MPPFSSGGQARLRWHRPGRFRTLLGSRVRSIRFRCSARGSSRGRAGHRGRSTLPSSWPYAMRRVRRLRRRTDRPDQRPATWAGYRNTRTQRRLKFAPYTLPAFVCALSRIGSDRAKSSRHFRSYIISISLHGFPGWEGVPRSRIYSGGSSCNVATYCYILA